MKILLIEDNEFNRDMLSRRLARRGFEVLIATDGLEGVKMSQEDFPDLILLDIKLPELSGFAIAQQLKSNATTQHIPIIALTAHAMAIYREQALAAGCDAFYTKPINFEKLLEEINKFIR